jgi:cytochrome b subunit of formate dehydrogenase
MKLEQHLIRRLEVEQAGAMDGIDFLDDQHPFLVEPRCRSREGEGHQQAKQGEDRTLDRAQAAPFAFRFSRAAPETNATPGLQQDGIFGFRSYLYHEVLRKEIALDRDDWRWLLVRTLGILGRSKEELPPQGSYNAGQKLFGLAVYSMVPVIMLTGLVMTFGWPSLAAVGWAVVLHFTAVGLVVSGLMIHVYMAAVFPEEKPAFFSMITGSVHELYAYSHHFEWWREEKEKQVARRAGSGSRGEGPGESAVAGGREGLRTD